MSKRLAPALVFCSFGLLVPGQAFAAPKPPPKFWSAARCEHVLVDVYGWGSRGAPGSMLALPAGDGHVFNVAQAVCVGSGGALTCRWTLGRRARLYSQFTVFARSPLDGGVVRSWTLRTRARRGFAPVPPRRRGPRRTARQTPPAFYMTPVRGLAADATPARFRSLVSPLTSALAQREKNAGCTGG